MDPRFLHKQIRCPNGHNREIGERCVWLRLHKPMRSRRRNAEDAPREALIRFPRCHWETGKAERTMMQSRKTYRISCAGVPRPVGERRLLCILRWTGRQAFFV